MSLMTRPFTLALLLAAGAAHGQDCAWMQVNTANAPSPRHAAAVAYDSARGRFVLFGGSTSWGGVPNGEPWEWNGSTWIQFAVPGPSPRFGHAMVFHAGLGVVVMYGGAGDLHTWTWNGSQWNALPGFNAAGISQLGMAY